ncbi:hypothetical protein VNN36_06260 [Lactococcus garvieae]|uniref:hypothetical protein n=1 Tax=Lactococcus garvieae TaxID=1363 RepID=UPI0030D55F6B
MTKTAKERIEEEIKDVNRSLVYSLSKNNRAFDSGIRQGLTIALAHIQNATTLVTSDDTVTINKNVYDLVINKVNKQREQLAKADETLKRITEIPDHEEYFDCEECISMMEEAAKQALAEIGGEDE